MKSIVVAIALAAAALASTAASAKTNECGGLQTCVPVAGPWVVVPISLGASRPHVEYQLSCPVGFVVGGIDVELATRSIDVTFLGRSGSPVNPGITTERAAVFLATYVGTGATVASFRPHLGCIPARGGGGRVPTVVGAVPAGNPITRRSRDVRLLADTTRVIGQACAARERLVGSSDATGFYTSGPPSQRLVRAVTLGTRTVRGRKVELVARAGSALRGVGAVVQVAAVCAVGT